MEVSPGGRFVSTASPAYATLDAGGGGNELLVTDSWCLYHRPKPSQVYARDAQTLADLIAKQAGMHAAPSPSLASMSLTHGPNVLAGMSLVEPAVPPRFASSVRSFLGWSAAPPRARPLFPLPTSASQDRIHRLLADGAPAVVVEGPPGCGKTHAVANVVCSHLARGRRVLVTSKGAPALAVLRRRLPACVRELCVDATVSEAAGMQQLQQTVERLADRVSHGVDRTELCRSLAGQIAAIAADVAAVDARLEALRRRKCDLLQSHKGQELAERAFAVLHDAPWLAATVSKWEDTALLDFVASVEALSTACPGYHDVAGYESPPSGSLVAGVAARTGGILPSIVGKTVQTVSSLPLVGPLTGARRYQERKEHEVKDIQLFDRVPSRRSEWNIVHRVLERNSRHCILHESTLAALIEKEGWPREAVYNTTKDRLCFNEKFVDILRKAGQVRVAQATCLQLRDLDQSIEAQQLEAQRQKMAKRLQELDEKLVEARVVTQLGNMFSPEAQSSLIQFSQLAGKAKFKSNAQASRLTARQQRHRQAYLRAFEKCVRYIPCWILTTNQVNDYLPAEFGLFDLCIMDEASQSDITALPSMLRGKQWLVVGDGKQVSPTENFTAEAAIEALRASLPRSPFRECFLPGHSFFDMCLQAFPIGRVVLSEHFRCSPSIIKFSNDTYYQSRLQPLRLPTSNEVMRPSLVDVYLPNGRKVGKINEVECSKIVEMIKEMVDQGTGTRSLSRPRSIGVITLIGDAQSRLIRGRLLDAIGPKAYNDYDILVGEPPSFQGSERDVVFLSMISSPGSAPTQSQLMYHQRINVALSRARDRMVLVRSINRSHIPSLEDAKVAVLDFFSEFASTDINKDNPERVEDANQHTSFDAPPVLKRVIDHVAWNLRDAGFTVRPMGVVWEGAICVEDESTGARAAVAIENSGELKQEWAATVLQQRAIERVGWKCYRIDTMSWLLGYQSTLGLLHSFLRSVGVKPKEATVEVIEHKSLVNASGSEGRGDQAVDVDNEASVDGEGAAQAMQAQIVVISSNDEGEEVDFVHVPSDASTGCVKEDENDDDDDDGFDPSNYGSVIRLCGMSSVESTSRPQEEAGSDEDKDGRATLDQNKKLGPRGKRKIHYREQKQTPDEDSPDNGSDLDAKPRAKRNQSVASAQRAPFSNQLSNESYHGDESGNETGHPRRNIRHKHRSVIHLCGMSSVESTVRPQEAVGSDDDKDGSATSDQNKKLGSRGKRKIHYPEQKRTPDEDSSDNCSDLDAKPRAERNQSVASTQRAPISNQLSNESYHGHESGNETGHPRRNIRRKRYRRLDAHSRDGRWYPSHDSDKSVDHMMDAEEEEWVDLKDVVSTVSSYRDDEDKSITSRLRSSL